MFFCGCADLFGNFLGALSKVSGGPDFQVGDYIRASQSIGFLTMGLTQTQFKVSMDTCETGTMRQRIQIE